MLFRSAFRLDYETVLQKRYAVMDMTAFALCQDNNLPILVVDFWAEGDLLKAVQGDHSVGTLISNQV